MHACMHVCMYGMVWYGMVWIGMDWYGMVCMYVYIPSILSLFRQKMSLFHKTESPCPPCLEAFPDMANYLEVVPQVNL